MLGVCRMKMSVLQDIQRDDGIIGGDGELNFGCGVVVVGVPVVAHRFHDRDG